MNIDPKLIETLKRNKIDYGCTAIFFIAMLVFIIQSITLQIIPSKFLVIIAAALLVIFFIFIILDIKEMKGLTQWSKRICSITLSIVLIIGSGYMMLIDRALGSVDNGSTMRDQISILVPVDSDIETIADLSDKKIGYQNANDRSNSDYLIDLLLSEPTLNNPSYEAYNDYLTLSKALINKEVDAMIFTDSYTSTLKEQIEDFNKQFKTIATYTKESEGNQSTTTTKDISNEPFTVYISGMDELGEPTINLRSDVNLLLLINPITNHIEMVSIPRDAYVPNVATNNYPDKLTHTGLFGIDTTIKTMENVFGFDINYYAKVSFTSLIEIVDTLGGIEAEIPINFCEQDENRSFETNDLICLNQGLQTLDGREALAYSRHRKSYGDIQRTMAQQDVIKGIINQILSPSGITKVPALLDIGPKYVSTNVPMDQVKKLINKELENIQPWTFSTIHMENGVFDLLPTSSMGAELPLSVYVLSQYDVQNVYQKYLEMYETLKFNDFSFDLNDLDKNKAYPKEIPQMLWSHNYQTKITQFYSLDFMDKENEEETDGEEDPNKDPNGDSSEPNPDGTIPTPDDGTTPTPPTEPNDPSTPPSEPIVPEEPVEPTDPVDEGPLDPTIPLDETSD